MHIFRVEIQVYFLFVLLQEAEDKNHNPLNHNFHLMSKISLNNNT